ncbi:MAG: hypothetical protein KDK99_07350 [Verrucomicrobiales bacterium]|nr:hypothetical protein [Verrucomicrobiales bacterium]
MKFRHILAGLLFIIALGASAWWLAGRRTPRSAPPSSDSALATPTDTSSTATQVHAPDSRPSSVPTLPPPPDGTTALLPAGAPMEPNDPQIDEKIHAILTSETLTDEQAAIQLLDLISGAKNLDQKVELSQHAMNLLPDHSFDLAGQRLLDVHVPMEVKEVIYSDALNRPPNIHLPVLAEVALQSGNPFAQEAWDTLTIVSDLEPTETPPPDLREKIQQQVLAIEAEEAPPAGTGTTPGTPTTNTPTTPAPPATTPGN